MSNVSRDSSLGYVNHPRFNPESNTSSESLELVSTIRLLHTFINVASNSCDLVMMTLEGEMASRFS